MSLAPGARLGPYEIIAAIGAGGMGEVYRARDTQLNRDVAIKILPDLFAADTDRVARFQREAQVLASLNHPNIAHIHGLEDLADGKALVLELVDGPTLADLIAKGRMAPEEALRIARQIAEALEGAHERGIIHRDLKPANIKLTTGGTVKVLDFGLAKAQEGHSDSGLTNSPTMTSPAMATHAGMILGTASYMSPEQAKGKPVDRRTDVWAFGCVLYEMLTGVRAFAGEDVTDSIAFIITKEPDWTVLPPNLSPAVAIHLRRCLEKDRHKRIHDIADMRLALEGAFDAPAAAQGAAVRKIPRGAIGAIAVAAVVLVIGAAAAGWLLGTRDTGADRRVRRFALGAAPGLLIANNNRDLVLTPDGTRVVYFASEGDARRLYVRSLDSVSATAVRDAPNWYEPFASPDGKWIGFNDESNFTLRKISLAGGPPVAITPLGREMFGASWAPDDSIIFATSEVGTGLRRVPASASGGKPTVLTKPDAQRGEILHAWPEVLPGGHAVLFTIQVGDGFQIGVLNLDSGTQKVIVPAGTNPRFVRPGYLIYGIEEALHAVRFDPVALEVIGDPVRVLQGVLSKSSGGFDFSVGADGTLAYVAGSNVHRRLVWVDRSGSVEAIPVPPQMYGAARVSPDGTRIALEVGGQQRGTWVWDIARETLTAVDTSDNHLQGYALLWTPDGKRVVFVAGKNGAGNLYSRSADGSGAVERMTESPNDQTPSSFSRDGSRLIFGEVSSDRGMDLRMLPLDGQRRDVALLDGKYMERTGELSPDGQLFAYQSDESGRGEVYVARFPDVKGDRIQVSSGGGGQPAWAGNELFYVAANRRVMSVNVMSKPNLKASPRQVVLNPGGYFFGVANRTYDVSRDGKRFLFSQAQGASNDAVVVLNWLEEVKQHVPLK